MQLVVAGFHRSGTSMLTQLLVEAGLFVGDDLLGAMPSNPYGHFEDREVLRLHRSILERHGDDWQWDSPFPFYIGPDHWRAMRQLIRRRELAHQNWGFKDPRVCLFLGAWKYLLPDARFVIIYRDPGECVRSLESRQASDYFSGKGSAEAHLRFFREPDHGLRLWDTYNRALVAFARHHAEDCLVLPFTALTERYPVVDRVNARFGSSLTPVRAESVFDPRATSRRRSPQRVIDPEVGSRVRETWSDLTELTRMTETP
jgi:hypothetical protein